MKQMTRKLSAVVVVCALLASAERIVLAQKPADRQSQWVFGASNGQVVGMALGAAAAGALIGVGIHYAVKHGHTVTGCAHSGPDGMSLTSESDKQTYMLAGATAEIKDGERVRLSGTKEKVSSGRRQFLVEKVSKDFGRCEVASSLR